MFLEERKKTVIEELRKVTDEKTLIDVEYLLKKKSLKKGKKNIHDFVGILSKSEAGKMRNAIEDMCETISHNDWK